MNQLSMIATFFKQGGVFMYFILSAAVVIVAIAIERFIVIRQAAALDSRKLVADILRYLRVGDLMAARNLARSSNAPAAQVAGALLAVGEGDIARLQLAADDAATLALPPLSRRLAYLNVLANVCTLLGLLGTISGLITAFTAVGAADPSQRSSLLAAGISTALNATAFGLICAIPTLVLHGYLIGMLEGIAEQVDETSIRISQALVSASGHAPAQVVPMHARTAAASTVVVQRPSIAAQGGAQ